MGINASTCNQVGVEAKCQVDDTKADHDAVDALHLVRLEFPEFSLNATVAKESTVILETSNHGKTLHLLGLQCPRAALLIVQRPEDGNREENDKHAVQRLDIGHKGIAKLLRRRVQPMLVT